MYKFSLIFLYSIVFSQNIEVINNTENYNSNPIVYNNKLFFSINNKLNAYTGSSIETFPEPQYNGVDINGKLNGDMFILNNKLFFDYDVVFTGVDDWRSKEYLVSYEGSTLTSIINPYPVNSYGGINIKNDSFNKPVFVNDKIYMLGGDYQGAKKIFEFNGQTINRITSINQSNSPTVDISLGDYAMEYNGLLLFYYSASYSRNLAKYDGTSMGIIKNSNNEEYRGQIQNFNNSPYFRYYTTQNLYGVIGKYNQTNENIELYNIPNIYLQGFSVIYNGSIYFNCYSSTSSKYKLLKFDGTSHQIINNINTNDNGVINKAIVFQNKLFLIYQDANNKNHLAYYDSTNPNQINVIDNLNSNDTVAENQFYAYNGVLYFIYTSSGKNYLGKYDGQNLSSYTNPDSGAGVNGQFIIFQDQLYFSYVQANGKTTLAKLNTPLSTTEQSLQKSVFVSKESGGFSILSKSKMINSIEMYDSSGKKVLEEKFLNTKQKHIEFNHSGVYIIHIKLNNNISISRKIIL